MYYAVLYRVASVKHTYDTRFIKTNLTTEFDSHPGQKFCYNHLQILNQDILICEIYINNEREKFANLFKNTVNEN